MARKLVIGKPHVKKEEIGVDIVDTAPTPIKRRVTVKQLNSKIAYLDASIAKFQKAKDEAVAERDEVNTFVNAE